MELAESTASKIIVSNASVRNNWGLFFSVTNRNDFEMAEKN